MTDRIEDGATEQTTEQATAHAPDDPRDTAFIETVAMENDPEECFPGDRGVLDPEVRRVLVRLLQRRFLLAERNPEDWSVLLENQQIVESRLHDLFVRLVVDQGRGVAYKQQIRSDELEVPVLLRDDAYTRPETLVLVYLRTVYQRESTAGEPSVRVDVEEIEQTVLSYFADGDGNTARRQKAIGTALARLRQEGIVEEESEGRYRISPLVEIVLSAERLRELDDWLREQARASRASGGEGSETAGGEGSEVADGEGSAPDAEPAGGEAPAEPAENDQRGDIAP
ncbi:DUF4194 domain-containing protein [Leucobacter ruminantium]|uniref:DUF4194 domain-containing protein n=1 Tax=Leucobacter ruminantium TaxID=1289170 RepID=A0A939LXI0_9MICO|nr:DUF4194 domain-containing protein [Leucobacter ruminantium]